MSSWNPVRWLRTVTSPASIRRRPSCRVVPRLLLEPLEDRLAPATFTVMDNSDSATDTKSLRYALANAASLGITTIDFAAAVRSITLTSNTTLTIATNLTIQNDQGAGPVTVDGNKQTAVFTVSSGVTASLSGLTITHGGGVKDSNGVYVGGGIFNQGTLTVSNCTVSASSAAIGGGIFSGVPHAFTTDPRTLTVMNCTISGNSAGEGGGIYSSGALSVSESTLSGNSAFSYGGGVYNEINGTLTLANSTLSGNSAGDGGGGIDNNNVLNATNSTLFGNTTGGLGGGLWNEGYNGEPSAPQSVLNSLTITGNRTTASASGGGGIDIDTTFSNALTLNNTIVAGNFDGANSGTAADDVKGTVIAASAYNLIGTGGSGGLANTNGNQVGVSLAAAGLASLGSYGGPTQTVALAPGSVALGTGATFTTATTDQRDAARPVNSPSDIGAFQGIANFVLAQFPNAGIWEYVVGGGWKQLDTVSASLLATDAAGDVFAEFPGAGLWQYTQSAHQWKQLTPADASLLATDAAGDVFAEFPGAGLWQYSLSFQPWKQLTPADASLLAADAIGDVFAGFSGAGLWQYSLSFQQWEQLDTGNASLLAADAAGDVFAGFSGAGLWQYSQFTQPWKLLTPSDASLLAADAAGDVFAEFSGAGLWQYSQSSQQWVQLTASDASLLAVDMFE